MVVHTALDADLQAVAQRDIGVAAVEIAFESEPVPIPFQGGDTNLIDAAAVGAVKFEVDVVAAVSLKSLNFSLNPYGRRKRVAQSRFEGVVQLPDREDAPFRPGLGL